MNSPTAPRATADGVRAGLAGGLTAGAVKVDITPADLSALDLLGGGSFTAVHDPVHMRLIVIGDGLTEIALVTIDAIEVGDMTLIRERIEAELGIPADHVAITASHCHNAPRLGLMSAGAFSKNGGPESLAYTARVYDQIIDGLSRARAGARPALLGLGVGAADVNVNRDEFDPRTGSWTMGCDPEGPSDKALWVLRFTTRGGDPIAVVLNYAVHPQVVFGTREVSADLAGAATGYVEDRLGSGAVALWTAGPLGDQAPRIALGHTDDPARDKAAAYAAMEAQGRVIGEEAVRVAEGITATRDAVRIRVEERLIVCSRKPEGDPREPRDAAAGEPATVELRLLLLLLGDIALAGVSGEVVVPLYEKLCNGSPLPDTLVLSMVNDRIGYVADEGSHDRGTFEAGASPLRRGDAERFVVDGFADMIARNLE
jgi:neutral ceramidase